MKKLIIIAIALLVILLSSSLYTVNETQVAIKLRLGEIVSVENKPGLKFKTPFVNNVVTFDKRIQTLDSAAESFLTVEKKNVVVDSYVKWRIVDTEKFYISTGGAMASANLRLAQNNQDALRTEFSKRTIIEVVSDEREAIMATVKPNLKPLLKMNLVLKLLTFVLNELSLLRKLEIRSIVEWRQREKVSLINSVQRALRRLKKFKPLQTRKEQSS